MRSVFFLSGMILAATTASAYGGHSHGGHRHGECCLPQPAYFAGYHPTCWRRWPDPNWGCAIPKRLAPVPPQGPPPTAPDEQPAPGDDAIPPEQTGPATDSISPAERPAALQRPIRGQRRSSGRR